MNRKLKGFSLAELLISLLVISIVLSAAIPTLTKRSGADREFIWRWTSQGNSAYFGVGSNQSAILGLDAHPAADSTLDALLTDPEETDSADEDRPEAGVINTGDLKFSSAGDKLVILKKTIQGNNSNFMNSHISFFTLSNNEAATTDDIAYAGRLAMDPGNIALGMGSLQSINEDNVGENTAIGHYALLRDTEGYRNTAVGKKTLSYITSGSYNTALGYASLFQLGDGDYDENTAIGALSQLSGGGTNNTSVGSQSLARNRDGDNNTVIGKSALARMEEGSNNTALGTNACGYIKKGEGNICIGYQAGNYAASSEVNYGLFIGSGTTDDDPTSPIAPLISGHTKSKSGAYDKDLIVNALNVEFRPPHGIKPSFTFQSWAGYDDGYGDTNEGQHGIASFYLRDTGNATDGTSVQLDFRGGMLRDNPNPYTFIDSYDGYNTTATIKSVDIMFNHMLAFDFPPATIDGTNTNNKISLAAKGDFVAGVDTLVLNDKLEVQYHNDTPNLTLNESGFSLFTDGYAQEFSINNTDDNPFKIKLGNNVFLLDKDNFFVKTGNMSIASDEIQIKDNGSGSPEILVGQNVKIDTNDIMIYNQLSSGVGQSIKQLQQQMQGQQSDARLKNISGDNTAGLKEINALEVKNYTYKNDEKKTPHVGVIAQQLQKIFPNSVFKGDDGYLRIRTEEIFYAMVNSIKDLCKQIQDLTAKVTGLDKRITELEQQNKLLIEQNKAFEKRLEKLEKQSSK